MADTNLTRRIADLEAEIARLNAAVASSRRLRRRLNGKLTDRKLKTFNKPNRIIGDGNNLLYKCGGLGHGCWIYRYKVGGKACDIGLGGYPAVSLAEARIGSAHLLLRAAQKSPRRTHSIAVRRSFCSPERRANKALVNEWTFRQ